MFKPNCRAEKESRNRQRTSKKSSSQDWIDIPLAVEQYCFVLLPLVVGVYHVFFSWKSGPNPICVPIHARTCRQDQIYREVPMNKNDIMYKSMISRGPTLCGVQLFIFLMLSCSSKKLVAKPLPDIPIIAPGTRLVVKSLINFLKGQWPSQWRDGDEWRHF